MEAEERKLVRTFAVRSVEVKLDHVPFFVDKTKGSEEVDVRNSSNEIVLTLHAAGPVTEEVIPNVGRNGEDGIIRKRVYKDADGKRWIYQNLDAHPSFRSTEDSDLVISCFP